MGAMRRWAQSGFAIVCQCRSALQAPVEHELRLTLVLRDDTDHVLVEAGRQRVGLDVRDEAVLVLLRDECVEVGRCAGHR